MSDIETHQDALLQAFADVIRAEEAERMAKVELTELTNRLKFAVAKAESAQAQAWAVIQSLMAETGETEVTLPGNANDFVIGWSKPRESVTGDPDAAPDEYVVVERKLKKKEVGEYLKTLRDTGNAYPNWARLEPGERKLGYKLVKKSAS